MRIKTHILDTLLCLSMLCLAIGNANAQESKWKDMFRFDHLDIAASLGTTGIGIDVATPATDWLRVRAGVNYMPHFNVPMTFELQSFTEDGLKGGDFSSLQNMILQTTGFNVDEKVKTDGHCRFADFKLMLDFFPIPGNKHWTATAGFYWGAKKIGHVQNTIEEAPSLVGVLLFNHMYDYFVNERYMDDPIYNDIYIDPEMGDLLRDKFRYFGRVGVNMGTFKDTGKPYLMVPNSDGMVKADMFVHSFKPYLGLGYETALSKDQKWNFGVNLGCLFWGGSPRILTHDQGNGTRVDISNEVEDVPGKVGDYVEIAKSFKVYPNLSVRFSYRIF